MAAMTETPVTLNPAPQVAKPVRKLEPSKDMVLALALVAFGASLGAWVALRFLSPKSKPITLPAPRLGPCAACEEREKQARELDGWLLAGREARARANAAAAVESPMGSGAGEGAAGRSDPADPPPEAPPVIFEAPVSPIIPGTAPPILVDDPTPPPPVPHVAPTAANGATGPKAPAPS